MSQLKIYGPTERDPLDRPLVNTDDLIEIFHRVERQKNDWLLGIEYEIFGQINQGTSPLPYEGPVSISSLYRHLAKTSALKEDPFIGIHEGEHIVALSCKRAIIALEPGGQIEIAARPFHLLQDTTDTLSELVKEIQTAAHELGIDLFALGIHPLASRNDMATVKKTRYDIMRAYMGQQDELGIDMMTRSCAIQINLDFQDEKDMAQKTRLAAALVPFYSLLCASTAFIDGHPSTHAVERGHVWRKTDKDRTGIPSIIFDKNFGYGSWIDMVLDVPMYFIRRGPVHHNVAGASFRDFIRHGLDGHHATQRDFADHMTTVFTEVRLKPILELRSADSLPLPFVNALTALTAALFYNHTAKDQALELFDGLTHPEITTFHHQVIDVGRQAQFRQKSVFAVTKKLLDIAHSALSPTKGSHFLEPFFMLIEQDTTCAEWVRSNFPIMDKTTLPRLVKSFDPSKNPLDIISRPKNSR